ncbi:hypothetical protein [Chryseobacterium taeanense]|uniref:hypothetical protein n=1 Tax=Chryseobacterium taeanense TaxID=311334 RepID=UPI001585EECD|nr:hypothetical protein [Chryseobacterium taeanense]
MMIFQELFPAIATRFFSFSEAAAALPPAASEKEKELKHAAQSGLVFGRSHELLE